MHLEELAYRGSQDADVQLLWGRDDDSGFDRTFVRVTSEDAVDEVEVAPEQAMEAFDHPFVYLGGLAVKYAA